MKRRVLVVLCAVLILVCTHARATSCDEDCVGRCRRCVSWNVGFAKDEKCITEPSCNLQCEIEKKAACAIKTPVPHIPSASDIDPINPGKILQVACKTPFEDYVHSVVAVCANSPGRSADLNLIDDAKNTLIGAGIYPQSDFSGVDIRWCDLRAASGMTPVKDHVLLNPNLKSDAAGLAEVLGHEMVHIAQFRRWRTDDFECRYSQQLPKGTGRDNSVEEEAYAFQDSIKPIIEAYLSSLPIWVSASSGQIPSGALQGGVEPERSLFTFAG